MKLKVKQEGEHDSLTVTRSTNVGTALSKREHTADIELPANHFSHMNMSPIDINHFPILVK
jgi:hypothetical protein